MNFKTSLFFGFAMLLAAHLCLAQTMPTSYFESHYGKLEYGFYVPQNRDGDKPYPLVTYLHGWSNNYTVYLDWYNSEIQEENPCFVFTPKTPTTWADWSGWWTELSEPMIAALHVMDSLVSVYPIDKDRLYVYGISMGGEGVFDLLDKLPEKFAAAMSVCGGGRPEWAGNIANTPLWMFHGSADPINPVDLTERVYNELVAIGAAKMRFKVYPGYGHEIWNVAAAEPSWHDWMFAHSRTDTACPKPSGKIELAGAIIAPKQIRLSWNDIRNPEQLAEKIWYYKIYNRDGVIGTTEYNQTNIDYSVRQPVDTFWVSAVNYHFMESDVSNIVCYKDSSGSTKVGSTGENLPGKCCLESNYPNPFNPLTTIQVSVARPAKVLLKVYNSAGQVVQTLMDQECAAGYYDVQFDGTHLSTGIYICDVCMEDYRARKKMLLIK